MTKPKPKKDHKKPGRPRTLPDGTFTRSYRATADEHARVADFLKGIRAQKPKES